MRGINHGQPFGVHACRWLCALALGGVSLNVHAQNQATRISTQNIFANSPALTHIPVQGGGSVSIAQASGAAVSTRLPLTLSSVGTGPIMNGVLRANPGATLGTVDITAGARLPTTPPVDATVKIPVDKAQLGAALRNFAKRALPLVSTVVALKGLIDDLKLLPPDTADGPWRERITTDGLPTTGTIYEPIRPEGSGILGTYSSNQAACNAFAQAAAEFQSAGPGIDRIATNIVATGSLCQFNFVLTEVFPGTVQPQSYNMPNRTATIPGGSFERTVEVPDSRVDEKVEDAPLDKWAPAFEEITRQGESVPPLSEPKLSGPSSATNPQPTTTTTTNPDGTITTQTQQQRINITYNNNNYSTTTTNTTNTTNNTTNETTTTETENPEESDLCKNNPDILACSKPELDTPDEEIPRRSFVVTFAAETLFGSGSCPSNKTMNLRGQNITVWDFAQTCDLITTYFKPMLLTLALFSAFLILSPGKDS